MQIKNLLAIIQDLDPEMRVVLRVYNDDRLWNIDKGDIKLEFSDRKPTIVIGW